MRIGIETVKATTWVVAAKPCDSCKSAPAAVFCRVDSASSCLDCDSRIHRNKHNSRHARVLICEVCEQAPAAVRCKADAAVLCVTCDHDIHSANPLASRHERVPVEPFYDSPESIMKSSNFTLVQNEEPGSWLFPPDPNLKLNSKFGSDDNRVENKTAATGDLFFSVPFMNFNYPDSFQLNSGTDSVVPGQTKPTTTIPTMMNNENCFNIDFCKNKISTLSYTNQPLAQSVSSSSLDVGVVPDGSDIAYRNTSASADQSQPIAAGKTTSQATPLCGMDREARVLRYREKRKNRKFEKTIRYASRKAYAETRPRIKGRFTKRTKMDSDIDKLYNSAARGGIYMDKTAHAEYGVVPSF